LIGFGGVVLVVALLGDAIESIESGGGKLRMRAAAAEKFALAEQAGRGGDSDTARGNLEVAGVASPRAAFPIPT
jgi:hypothetical protein